MTESNRPPPPPPSQPPSPEPMPIPPTDPPEQERQKQKGLAALLTAGSGLGCILLGTMPFGAALILWGVYLLVRGCSE
ncbi:MAG TPA: hypothetical protein VGR35_13730 [Tepidisphaeraceae bacterium]|nr:hypothetical protein [Tepidisphaeraceae bacterium]